LAPDLPSAGRTFSYMPPYVVVRQPKPLEPEATMLGPLEAFPPTGLEWGHYDRGPRDWVRPPSIAATGAPCAWPFRVQAYGVGADSLGRQGLTRSRDHARTAQCESARFGKPVKDSAARASSRYRLHTPFSTGSLCIKLHFCVSWSLWSLSRRQCSTLLLFCIGAAR
jgi:hypothetical protein